MNKEIYYRLKSSPIKWQPETLQQKKLKIDNLKSDIIKLNDDIYILKKYNHDISDINKQIDLINEDIKNIEDEIDTIFNNIKKLSPFNQDFLKLMHIIPRFEGME